LIELLTVIAIIAVLAALTIVGIGAVRKQAKVAAATAQFHEIATAIMLYTAESKARTLPGPLASGHNFEYSKTTAGAQRSTRILSFLAPYLGLEPPTGNSVHRADAFMTAGQRAWFETPEATANGAPIFFVANVSGIRPFGYESATDPSMPLPIVHVENPATTRMISEADQTSVWVSTSNGWFNRCPATPLHGSVRLACYFDGSVRAHPVSKTNRQ
jgi:type II secretory pathway pseudopilin PulG